MNADNQAHPVPLRGVTVGHFRAVLLDAAEHTDVVQPPALREPISLWLRSVEERARRENWQDLLGRHVVDAWGAAQAILTTETEHDDLHQNQGCGYRWNDMIGFLNPGPSRRHLCAKEVHTLNSEHECRCGDTRPNVDPLLDMDPHARQTCGFRWDADDGGRIGTHQCGNAPHGLNEQHDCDCGARRPGVVVLGADIGREA